MRRTVLLAAGLAACAPMPPRPATVAVARMPVLDPAPPAPLDRLVGDGRLGTLAAAIRDAGIGGVLAGRGPLTLFAPTDAAWARLAPGVGDQLLRPENRGSLLALLRFHIVPGRIDAAELRRRAAAGPVRLPTLAGEPLTVTVTGDALMLTDASGHRAFLTAPDRPAANGVLHEVNGLLVPQVLGPQPPMQP